MAGRNIVVFYVEKSRTSDENLKKLKEIVSKLNTSLEDYCEDYYDDGIEYYSFKVSRPNHYSMSNGTKMKIELEDEVSVDDYVEWIKELVDNIV